jgi:hypothetical protein
VVHQFMAEPIHAQGLGPRPPENELSIRPHRRGET